jgi:uroporphyrinogen-III synthase
MQPQLESTIGLLDELKKLDIKDKNILLVRPKTGPSKLLDSLTDAGANTEQVMIYTNIDLEPADIDFNAIDKILFTSGSTIRAFLKHYGSVPHNIEILCLGQPTLKEAKIHNIDAKILNSSN